MSIPRFQLDFEPAFACPKAGSEANKLQQVAKLVGDRISDVSRNMTTQKQP